MELLRSQVEFRFSELTVNLAQEQKALDAANAVNDTVTEEVKKEMRKESRVVKKNIEDEEKITAFYQQGI